MADRQQYPVGDTDLGQLVQLSAAVPTKPDYFGGNSTITVAATAVDLSAPPDATYALVTVATGAIRFWLDGTDPTATVGHVAEPGATIELESLSEVHQFRTIRRDGTSGVLSVSFGYSL